MSQDVNVPKIGPVNKRVLIGAGVAVAGFLAWRYYLAGSGAESVDVGAEDAGYEDAGTIPAVEGATDWYGSGGDTSSTSATGTSTQILTNAQWSAYAREQLLAADAFNGQAISEALGNYLTGQALSSEQQRIVRAAIGVAGYPPVGTHPIIPGGDTVVTTAPTGLRADSVGVDSVHLVWNPMEGVSTFSVWRGGMSAPAGISRSGTTAVIGGLKSNTTYTFQVSARSASGQDGPRSQAITVKTGSRTLAKPATPTVVKVTASSVTVRTGAVPAADGYDWFLNGGPKGHSDGPSTTITGLKKKTRYTIAVRADVATQGPGPLSGARSFTTKSK